MGPLGITPGCLTAGQLSVNIIALEILVCMPDLHERPHRNPERGLRFPQGLSGEAEE